MRNQIDSFLKPFEKKISENIIEFGKRLSKTQADVYILMARKAACFIACLETLSLTEINGFVTTERILDMDTEYLKNKDIIILDDTIVSGTTLNRTIKKLNMIGVSSINIMVMAVNKDWYSKDLLGLDDNERSYVKEPYLILENQECIKQCSDIVKAISLIPRPYDVDYPLFTNIKISKKNLDEIIQFNEWESDETSSFLQQKNKICTITLTPRESAKSFFNEDLGFCISDLCVLKIRLYCKIPDEKSSSIILRVVPFAILHPLDESGINILFDSIIINSTRSKSFFYKEFKSANSKLRLVQYIISTKLAKFWNNSITDVIRTNQNYISNLLPPTFLFSPLVLDEIMELSSNDYNIQVLRDIKNVKLPNNEINNNFSTKQYDGDLISIQAKLAEPFLLLFQKRELPARELVKKFGKKAFQKDEYKILDRLNSGFSFLMLHSLIKKFSKDFNTMKIVSLFLDKAIDAGVVVPTNTVTENGIYYRAFRHGEDVQFGEEEEKLCHILLKSFSESSKEENLPHFLIEKLLVLLLQIGTQNNFLDPFISNTPKQHSVASVKYYLHGPVVTYDPIVNAGEGTGPPFLKEDRTSSWIPHILKKKDILKKQILIKGPKKTKVVRYKLGDAPKVLLDFNKEAQADNLGLIMGYLIERKTPPRINSSTDLISLTACLQPTQIAPALAAELTIFSLNWGYFLTPLKGKIGNKRNYLELAVLMRRNDKVFFTAMDSGYKKFIAFMRKAGHTLIEKITKELAIKDRVKSNNWRAFWSQNGKWEIESIPKDLWKNIIDSGLWLMCANIYVRIVELCLREMAVIPSNKRQQNKEACSKIVKRLRTILKALEHYSGESKKRAINIIPYVRAIINDYDSEKKIDYKSNLNLCLIHIEKLVYLSRQICDDTELIVKPFGKPLSISKYPHALFFEVETDGDVNFENNIENLINNTLRRFTKKIQRDKKDSNEIDRIHILQSNKNYLNKGTWILCKGNRSNTVLINVALSLIERLSPKSKVNAVLFAQLDNASCFKMSGTDNSNVLAGQFWAHVDRCSEFFEYFSEKTHELKVLTPANPGSKNEIDKIKDKVYFNENFECKSMNLNFGEQLMRENYTLNVIKKFPNKKIEEEVGIGIITVKPCETRAVLKLLENRVKKTGTNTNRTYHLGNFDGAEHTQHKIALVQQLQQGQRSVISAYNDLKRDYNPKLMVLLGIGGSIKSEVNLCDVVICDKIIYYDERKETSSGVSRRGDSYKIPALMQNYVNDFFVEYGEFPKLDASLNSVNKKFQIKSGAIGSGEAVIADKLSEIKEWLLNYTDKTMAIEMEAGGFAHAYYEDDLSNTQLQVGNIIIRGISDHADHKKDDKWREPAAENAAIALTKILGLMPDINSIK